MFDKTKQKKTKHRRKRRKHETNIPRNAASEIPTPQTGPAIKELLYGLLPGQDYQARTGEIFHLTHSAEGCRTDSIEVPFGTPVVMFVANAFRILQSNNLHFNVDCIFSVPSSP